MRFYIGERPSAIESEGNIKALYPETGVTVEFLDALSHSDSISQRWVNIQKLDFFLQREVVMR